MIYDDGEFVIPEAIEKYAVRSSSPEPLLFRKLVRRTWADTKYPQMQVGHLEGSFLKLLVKISKAKRILEIGTFTGYSALAMAEAMPAGGRLVTCDIDARATAIAREFWRKSSQDRKIELCLGPALETIRKIKGPLDLVFIDADKTNYIHYWNACIPKMRRGGLILADNVLWSGKVLRPLDPMTRAIVAFNRYVAKDKRVEAVMLTVRDGITLAYKK